MCNQIMAFDVEVYSIYCWYSGPQLRKYLVPGTQYLFSLFLNMYQLTEKFSAAVYGKRNGRLCVIVFGDVVTRNTPSEKEHHVFRVASFKHDFVQPLSSTASVLSVGSSRTFSLNAARVSLGPCGSRLYVVYLPRMTLAF